MSLPAAIPHPQDSPLIAGSVLPIQRAEELLATLPGVISARIVASSNGAVDEIHLLTTTEVTPKQTVRNVESALMAHLGMRVSHKKISVATSDDPHRPLRGTPTPVYTPAVPIPACSDPDTIRTAHAGDGFDHGKTALLRGRRGSAVSYEGCCVSRHAAKG